MPDANPAPASSGWTQYTGPSGTDPSGNQYTTGTWYPQGYQGGVIGYTDAQKNQANQAATLKRLQAFAQQMEAPLDPNDPYVQSVARVAASSAGLSSEQAGVGGGLATSGAIASSAGALTNLTLQRQQLGLQAEGLGQQQQQFDYNAYLNSLQAQNAKNSAMGSTVLGLGGAVVGGYFGGPAGATAGMQAGQGLGQQLGSAMQTVPYGGGY